jgi:hypothetical protein
MISPLVDYYIYLVHIIAAEQTTVEKHWNVVGLGVVLRVGLTPVSKGVGCRSWDNDVTQGARIRCESHELDSNCHTITSGITIVFFYVWVTET